MKILLIVLILLLVPISEANAHSGRTDSSGGHNCYVGACAGTYHYHNGGGAVQPSPVVYYTPTPTPISLNATMANDYNSQKNEYSIKFDWDDIPSSLGYSVSISKYPGSNPGPLVDTYKSVSRFNHVKSGTWYLNLKSRNLSSWSQVMYWSITLPNAETRTVR